MSVPSPSGRASQRTLPKHVPLKKILEFTEATFTFDTFTGSLLIDGNGGRYEFTATGIEELRAALRSVGKEAT